MTLHPIAAFHDNYIWVLHDHQRALAVDPGQADGLLQWLHEHRLTLEAILITHHHGDHTGGVVQLHQTTGARVVGPADETMPLPVEGVRGGERLCVLGHSVEVLAVPGHTAGHVAFYLPPVKDCPILFCGDTLFSGGCGRLFEGTPEQMLQSLDRLSSLPGDTRVCCAHEYTMSNLRFAQAVDPDNAALTPHVAHCRQLRERNQPTLPSSIELERQINPFLRCAQPALQAAALAYDPTTSPTALGVFTTLRAWKNVFA